MQPEFDVEAIPVRTRRQAMDLSLVLASQDIESSIQPPTEDHGWELLVARTEYQRALEALRLYREENKGRRWRQELPMGGMIFDWRSVLWFMLVAAFFFLSQTSRSYFPEAGRMDTAKVWSGEWWRLFTSILLHADPPHLLANITFGIGLLGLAMGSLGPGFALLGSYLAGVGANVALMFLFPSEHRSLGASGMVMGSLGLLAGQSLALLRRGFSTGQFVRRGLFGGFLLLVLLGFDPATDVAAHVGGFFSGVVLGAILAAFFSKWAHRPSANWVAETLCGALVLAAWYLALRSP